MVDQSEFAPRSWKIPTRRQFVIGVAATPLLAACSNRDDDQPNPAPTPSPTPTPTPSPSPTTAFVGAVYAVTNAVDGNAVAAFGRNSDGTLTAIDTFDTGGNGGVFDGTNDGLDPLISEDAIVAVDNRFLLVVNPGSNSISSLAINEDFSLTLVETAATGSEGPVSIAYNDGIVYVSNADGDGTEAPPAQRGNLTGLRLDVDTGELSPVAGSTRELTNRPSNVEFSPDGEFLIVSSWNAGSTMLPASNGEDSLVVYAVNGDGTLSADPVSRATSTSRGNAAGRNLPSVIGFEIVERDGRTIVITTDAREFPSDGGAPMLPQFQTASVSTWELRADGALLPLSLDVLTGPRLSTGTDSPTSACWIVVSPDRSVFWVSHASGAVISTFALNADGTVSLIEGRDVEGAAAEVGASNPLANADGFVDLTVSSDGQYVYLLLGLRGSIHAYSVESSGTLSPLLQATTELLPTTNSVGLVSVDPVTP